MTKTESTKKVTPPEVGLEKEVSPSAEVAPQSQPTEVTIPQSGPLVDREVIVKPVEPVASSKPLVPFDRWFKSKGFRERWKPGMVAFADTSIRRTMSDWDEVFKSY